MNPIMGVTRMHKMSRTLGAALGVALAGSLLVAEPADARRGGSFGSRGARTFTPPPKTQTAPQATAPVQRSMTPGTPAAQQPGVRPTTAAAPGQRRGGFLGGLGGGLLGGLLVAGLFGALMGYGFGTGAGAMLALVVQLALIAGLVWLLMRVFRRRQQPAMAGAAGWPAANGPQGAAFRPSEPRAFGGATYTPATPPAAAGPSLEIPVTPADREAFERLLHEVQDAFAREDYGALRERTTPEVMSYLAEELSQNATQGKRNAVSGTRLLEADVAEAWREGDRDFVTAALRYESVDVIRDRETGAVLSGDPAAPTETTEHWTFVRERGGVWKLSAIQ